MDFSLKFHGRLSLVRSFGGCLMAALGLVASFALAQSPQPYGAYHFLYPYDGNNRQLDLSKAAVGRTPGEACAVRSADEITGGYNNSIHPLLFVGMLDSTTCGWQWLNTTPDPDVVVNVPTVVPQFDSCAAFDGFVPQHPRPPLCPLKCDDLPGAQDPTTGLCWWSGPKGGGKPCPACGNPINPGTGNKFQEETDLALSGEGLRVVRAYNSGIPAHSRDLGGFWLHTYNRRVVFTTKPGEINTRRANVHRPDGRTFFYFPLYPGTFIGPSISDGDINDVLTELKDASGRTTGFTYLLGSTEETEQYDAFGRLIAIRTRSGLTQTLTYTDGTDGSTSGNGASALDSAGNPTTVVLERGLLLRVRDHFGRPLTFGYDSQRRIVKITDPAAGVYLYTYVPAGNGLSNLASVRYPDGHVRTYHYNEPANTSNTNKPNALTGVTDENGARYATYKYDAYGRAIESVHHANGSDVNRYRVNFAVPAAKSVVTDPLGTARSYSFQPTLGVVKNTGVNQPEPGVPGSAVSYDAVGNISARTDFNGNRTTYSYDARNLETSRTEGLSSGGSTTAQTRTITTEWHSAFRLPRRVAEPLRLTTYIYNADGGANCGVKSDNATLVAGVLCSKTIQATTDPDGSQGLSAALIGTPRTWTYTYNANGFVLTIDGPRSDVSDVVTYTYYSNTDADAGKRGKVATITNALGHLTSFTAYNAYGQPLTIIDANGVTTTLAYDARQRLTARSFGGEFTSYDYDAAGQLLKVALPDGSYLSYTYDTAHRLTAIDDNLGNRIGYTLDGMGNRTLEQVRDPSNQLAQTRSRVYNTLNRLFRELGAQNQTTEYAYDNQGNVVSVKDPVNHATINAYDALNRLRQVTDPALGVTHYAYNGLDALIQVTDPRSLATAYTVDGLGNLTQQTSPDSGASVNTYDVAGNLHTQRDAKAQLTTYAYDVLNRVALITFHDGSKQTYGYDQGDGGIGRLTSITERNAGNEQTSLSAYVYDPKGRVTSETRTLAGVQYKTAYSYDSFGRLSGMTYPSGRTLAYDFDAVGRVSGITTTKPGESPQTVVSNVAYHPFGGVKGYTLGNGQVYSRSIDQDGRIASYTLGPQSFAIGYDAASRIAFISDLWNPANSNTYDYDNLDRLISAVLPGTPYAYGYDAVGNRTSRTAGSSTDTYAYSNTSNRIASIMPTSGPVRNFVFDANGSTTADGINTYTYDVRGRMSQAASSIGTTTYQVNALGQRVRKTNSLGDKVFHYDTKGRLIAETDAAGTLKREMFYLGDIPVAVFQ